ncbi:MAG TPA: gephyrin-like molybdotransferase Glp, partial [Actinomycetota bacterium]|nr:gephyrin-like molybdotransferase Glp [Actinomycetota bacterium]
LPAADVPLREAFGCVLTADVSAPFDLPPFASSAMDGYAVRSADTAGAEADRPITLRIVGSVRMGRPPDVDVKPGGAVAVPTGGAVPPGADAIVPVEHCAVEGDRLLVLRSTEPGRHVRPAGEDVRAGDLLIPTGRRLGPGDLGLLASAGIAVVPVRPRARVGVLSTGDELVEPGDPRGEAATYDANAFTLDAAIRETGAVPVSLGRVEDDPERLARTLTEAAPRVDALVSSGGVAVGRHDPVKAAFAGGHDVEFLEVAMQPGKPQAFGTVAGRPYFGLPGNPVSVFVSFEAFVRPALLRMMGRAERRPTVTARLAGELAGPVEKVRFARFRVEADGRGWRAVPTGGGRSNLLATVARANGLAMVPAGVERLVAGDEVEVLLFRDPDDP